MYSWDLILLIFFFFFFFINFMILNNPILNFNNKFLIFKNLLLNFIKIDFNKTNNSKNSIIFLISIFLLIMMINLIDLLPFSFCLNSQLNLFFFFSFIMWLSIMFYLFYYFFKNSILHLVPSGCPNMLSPFMVVIEMISLMIRPITLSVRMSANLLAGHLLIHLLVEFSFFLINFSSLNLILSLLMLFILNLLEIGVSIIQPYIFCTLLNMYLCEN